MPAPAPIANVDLSPQPPNAFEDGASALARQIARDESAASYGPDLVSLATTSGRPDMGNAHPLTKWVYGWMRDRSPQDKRLVFEAANQRAGVGCTTEKQERAYEAVEVFVERYGFVPAAKEWDLWRLGLADDVARPPSAKFIRNAFGDWPSLREAFGEVVPRADALAHHELLSRNEHFSEDRLQSVPRMGGRDRRAPVPVRAHRLVPVGPSRLRTSVPLERFWAPLRHLGSAAEVDAVVASSRRRPGTQALRRGGTSQRRSATLGDRARTQAHTARSCASGRGGASRDLEAEHEHERSTPAAASQVDADHEPTAAEDSAGGRQERTGARRATGASHAPSRTEDSDLLELLTTWAGTVRGPLRFDAFEGFLGARPQGSLARSFTPFRNRFGTWAELLEHAGLADRSLAAVAASNRLSRPKAPPQAPRVPSGTELDVKLRWVRHADRHLGARMSYPQYDDWRARLQLAALRHARPIPAIPSSSDLKRCCGSWPLVKVAAGLLSHADLADQPDRKSHSRKRMQEYFLEARETCPFGFDEWAYSHWRRVRRRELLAAGSAEVRMPTADLLRLHFGGPEETWEQVAAELGTGGLA